MMDGDRWLSHVGRTCVADMFFATESQEMFLFDS